MGMAVSCLRAHRNVYPARKGEGNAEEYERREMKNDKIKRCKGTSTPSEREREM